MCRTHWMLSAEYAVKSRRCERKPSTQRFALGGDLLSLTANIVTAAITESLAARANGRHRRHRRLAAKAARHHTAPSYGRRRVARRRAATAGASCNHARQPAAAAQPARAGSEICWQPTWDRCRPITARRPNSISTRLTLPLDLPVSLPSKLVEQRPDMREYSALLHQATAQVGVATANMLPQITLSGSYGGEAGSFSDVFSPGSVVWSLAASLTQPIFKGGQLMHQRRAAVAAAQEAARQLQGHGHHGLSKCLRHACMRCTAMPSARGADAGRTRRRRTACPWFKRNTRAAAPAICRS